MPGATASFALSPMTRVIDPWGICAGRSVNLLVGSSGIGEISSLVCVAGQSRSGSNGYISCAGRTDLCASGVWSLGSHLRRNNPNVSICGRNSDLASSSPPGTLPSSPHPSTRSTTISCPLPRNVKPDLRCPARPQAYIASANIQRLYLSAGDLTSGAYLSWHAVSTFRRRFVFFLPVSKFADPYANWSLADLIYFRGPVRYTTVPQFRYRSALNFGCYLKIILLGPHTRASSVLPLLTSPLLAVR
jgi:hypothetical protein